ncbi:MAG: radical SAM protein [Phycisphaerales bacterium]|jgi:cyclic dehypoxanthinyl futalosine synthase|nr:radical SAM protein [Phycisphaerales bacterium]
MPYQPPAEHPHLPAADPGLLAAVCAGHARLTPEQGLELFRAMALPELGRFADARCRTLHGDTYRTYIIDRNINYTNVCTARCTFCAFRRDADDHDAYTLDASAIHDKIAELVAIGGTQILMQGGMNPALPLSWYTDLLRSIKSRFPGVHIHAFSPPEMIEFVNFFDPPGDSLEDKLRWVLVRLRDAGLDSLPGGGGEIFADPVRRKIGLGKCDADAWLTTMYVAHTLGMFTSATMMFGHVEGHADRVHHMHLVRQWQDRALREAERRDEPVGRYMAFISWPFQRENTPLGRVPDWGVDPAELGQEFPGDAIARAWDFGRGAHAHPAGQRAADVFDLGAMDPARFPTATLYGRRVRMSGASDYLRTQALSRLMLDNVYSIGSSWVTMGPHVGQTGLLFGASDMGSVMMEENVVSSAGTTYCLDEAVLCRLIRDAGFIPAQRNNTYDVLRIHDGPDAPDRLVTDWSQHRARRLHAEAPREPRPVAPASLTVSAR